MVCINIGRTFKLWEVYTALLASQWLNLDKNRLFTRWPINMLEGCKYLRYGLAWASYLNEVALLAGRSWL